MKQHIPVVRIVTPEPDRIGGTPNVLTRLTVDGQEWAVLGYSIDSSNIHDLQRVTLTFLADVTVTHSEKALIGGTG